VSSTHRKQTEQQTEQLDRLKVLYLEVTHLWKLHWYIEGEDRKWQVKAENDGCWIGCLIQAASGSMWKNCWGVEVPNTDCRELKQSMCCGNTIFCLITVHYTWLCTLHNFMTLHWSLWIQSKLYLLWLVFIAIISSYGAEHQTKSEGVEQDEGGGKGLRELIRYLTI